jgi:ABC-type transporter Mla subunit MlaD
MVGEEKDQKETLHLLVKMILALDGGLSKTSSMLVKLLSDFNKSLQMQELLPQMLQHKVETTKQLLVVKPTALARNLDAPSV